MLTAVWLVAVGGALAAGGALATARGSGAWWALPLLPIALLHPWMNRPGAVPVLMYHSVSAQSEWLPWARDISIRPATFERQMALLARRGHTAVSLADLVERRLSGRALPGRPVVVTLDDGYLDNWVAAEPILRRHRVPATVFVSLDFIEPGEAPRPRLDDLDAGRVEREDVRWAGYLNRGEIARLAAGGLVDVQAHGVDHGRVETGPEQVDTLSRDNWRSLAWVQWRTMKGPKWHWYRSTDPPAVPLGTPVRASAPALGAREWTPRGLEAPEAWEERVRASLERCRHELGEITGRPVRFFCWPEHGTSPRAREIALEVGFEATCGGDLGENRPTDDPTFVCRVHSGEKSLGFSWSWADDLLFHAKLRTHQGCLYWFPPLLLAHRVRRLVDRRLT